MLPSIIVYIYLLVGCYSLYKTVKIATNEKVQKKSKTIQRFWEIYANAPVLMTVLLFVLCLVFWLPLSLVAIIWRDEEVDDIEGVLKEEDDE